MKKTFRFAAAAALLMASSAVQARGISFNIEGQRIRIEAPRNCMSLSCISVMNSGLAVNMKNMNVRSRKASEVVEVASNASQVAPSTPPAPPVEAPPAAAPGSNTAQPAPTAANNVLPVPAGSSLERITDMPSTPPARAPGAAKAPATVATVTHPSAPDVSPVQQEAAIPATTPLGLWQTEGGNVRVEQCGPNICGYGEKNGKKSNELVLINMKPSSDHSRWTGRVRNPNDGKNYDSTIAMRGPNLMRVQGCILGGAFCGGTTWKRIS